jgi:hypothetical protein
MLRLNRRGVKPTVRPSGHVITKSFDKVQTSGAIPSNVIETELSEALHAEAPIPETMLNFGNNASNDDYAKRCQAV